MTTSGSTSPGHDDVACPTIHAYKYELFCKRTPVNFYPGAISSPQDIIPILATLFPQETAWREHCHALFLDNSLHVIGIYDVASGDNKQVIIDNRAIAVVALNCVAGSVIIAHNHPSGDPRPSEPDRRSTASLKRALSALGITLQDHIILGIDTFYSLAEDTLYAIPNAD